MADDEDIQIPVLPQVDQQPAQDQQQPAQDQQQLAPEQQQHAQPVQGAPGVGEAQTEVYLHVWICVSVCLLHGLYFDSFCVWRVATIQKYAVKASVVFC